MTKDIAEVIAIDTEFAVPLFALRVAGVAICTTWEMCHDPETIPEELRRGALGVMPDLFWTEAMLRWLADRINLAARAAGEMPLAP